MSEINDFLTYELVPFYRNLLTRTIREQGGTIDMSVESEC